MNAIYVRSLKHIALVKIATALWNQDDIRAFPDEFCTLLCSRKVSQKFFEIEEKVLKEWQEIEDKVVEKVSHLSQPGLLKKEILGCIKPIGLQILKWLIFHCDIFPCAFVKKNINRLIWTSQGTVDRKKTAEVLIEDQNLNVADRYKLACIYCIEDDILELWNKIPENGREYFYEDGEEYFLVIIWTYDINGKMSELREDDCTFYGFACEFAAITGNTAATEYFSQKLDSTEREEFLQRSAGYAAEAGKSYLHPGDWNDTLCFLLGQMDEGEKIKVFQGFPREVVRCFLDWPRQSLFMETTNRMRDFLSRLDCYQLLEIIVKKQIDGYKDCDYQELFSVFWQHSPKAHKKFCIRKYILESLLQNLIKINDEKNIKLILTDAILIEKTLISGYKGQYIYLLLVYNEKWDILKFLIRECI